MTLVLILVFWLSGILFTLGFNHKIVWRENYTLREKLNALADYVIPYLLLAWPFILGADIRAILDREN